jgi:CRISPR-associated endonuclease Csn1
MVQHYRYRLGVDMGIASIGTALVQIDSEGFPLKILDMGVRTFSTPEGAAERRTKRLERKHIRRKRQRLAKVRRILQEHGLLPTDTENLKQLILKDPYSLRALAATDKVSRLEDMGRCFLHMAKFRGAGFLTQQEEAAEQASGDEDTGGSSNKDKQKTANLYRKLEDAVRAEKQTLSQYLVELLKKKEPVRRRKFLVDQNKIEHAVPRFLVKEEFRRIWETQRGFYPELTEGMEDAIYRAIFQDFPHAPYAIGNCTLLPRNKDNSENKRLPRMHRLAEKRRIYEQINNIRYNTPEGECFLSRDLRDSLVKLAYDKGQTLGKKLLKDEITTATGWKVLSVNLGDDTNIKGFCHVKAFADIPTWHDMSEAEQDAVISFIAEPALNPADPASELYPEDEFLKKLCVMLRLEGAKAEEVASRAIALLAKDRSNLGLAATSRILGKLITGYEEDVPTATGATQTVWRAHTHRSAADACGFSAEEERLRDLQGSYATLPYYGEILRHDVTTIHPWHKKNAAPEEEQWGRIPNPVVHVALNQLRKVVNEIVRLYGKPASIHVEFARELGMSAINREALIKEMQKNAGENERITNELIEFGLTPSRTNRIKYKLWKEQGQRSLYSLKTIEVSDITACEIDHLIPRSKGGTDSMMNLCLCFADENKAKGDMYPYEMIQKTALEEWKEISKIISEKLPKAKARRFSSDAATLYPPDAPHGDSEEQAGSALTDTRYMAKMGARYLWALCSDVVAVKGRITSDLRHLWGLDGLEYELFGLPINEHIVDEQTGEVTLNPATGYPARNPLWVRKPRIDHRHHALDALVVACTTRGMVARLMRDEKSGKRPANFPVPFGDCAAAFRAQALQALQQVTPSPKAEHGTAGQLHDATKYRILRPRPAKGDYLIRYKNPLDKITDKKGVANIMFNANTISLDDEAVKKDAARCQAIISTIERYYPAAEDTLAAQQAAPQSGKLLRVMEGKAKEKAVVQKTIQLAQQAGQLRRSYPSLSHKSLVAINEALQFGYEPRSNYCMDFYESPDGKVGWECITRIDANDSGFVPKWKEAGGKHIWSLRIDDVIEVTPTDGLRQKLGSFCPSGKVYLVVQKMSEGRLQCNLLQDARPKNGRNPAVQAGLTEHTEYTRWDTGGIGLKSYCEFSARKIEISPFGKILRKHKRLWSGKKMAKKA